MPEFITDFESAQLYYQAEQVTVAYKMLECLERIAYNTLPVKVVEFEDFVKDILYASTGSKIQVQERDEDKASVRPRKSSGSKKHEDRSDTHTAGVRSGQEEIKVHLAYNKEDYIKVMADQEILEASGD